MTSARRSAPRRACWRRSWARRALRQLPGSRPAPGRRAASAPAGFTVRAPVLPGLPQGQQTCLLVAGLLETCDTGVLCLAHTRGDGLRWVQVTLRKNCVAERLGFLRAVSAESLDRLVPI